ncbi:hypothetical protein TNIN_229431 [Trichonephila inaurata madagascariensis]|uniref:Uncharacterized protein n=1 Tax=Trichonephila inaurata madagascariensis TaxID=2747483 RepID=A0A8X6MKJ2_9ARAC|nr:hypothetical protein TNIN_229431 [Trichonephila inaurata madagascariensis]
MPQIETLPVTSNELRHVTGKDKEQGPFLKVPEEGKNLQRSEQVSLTDVAGPSAKAIGSATRIPSVPERPLPRHSGRNSQPPKRRDVVYLTVTTQF